MTSQTSYIVGFLFLGFIIFIAIKGELPAYKAAIFGGTAPAPSGNTGQ